MKLYDISEPDETQSSEAAEPIVGIDLGTTNSLIALFKNSNVEIIPNNNSNYTKSIVAYVKNCEPIVGIDALKEEGSYYASIKRLMGKSINDLPQNYPYTVSAEGKILKVKTAIGDKTAIEISADILKKLKSLAEEKLGFRLKKIVLTVPAHFDDAARTETKNAAQLAGFEVLRLINEPTAAAIAYGFDKNPEGLYAIYDLGGGTFDVSILKMQKGIFQVLATGGDSNLGGDDFDKLLANYLIDKYKISAVKFRELLLKAVEIKHALSKAEKWEGLCFNTQISVTQDDYQKLIKPLIDRTLKMLLKCIKEASLTTEELTETILVGGATRTPYIKKRLQACIGKAPLDSINPDEAVVRGAAIQAHSLMQGSGNLLVDVLPLSLGIEVAEGIMEKLLYRNTSIPASCTQTFATQKDNQTAIQLHVLQGENERMEKCRSLAKIEVKNLPPRQAGAVKIEVTFQVDADGILTMFAFSPDTGKTHEVLIKPSFGLDEKEIKKLLQI